MNLMKRYFRSAALVTTLVFTNMISVATCFAQSGDSAGPTDNSGFLTWVPAYGVILLGVGLGVMVVVKSAGRREREKPKTFEE